MGEPVGAALGEPVGAALGDPVGGLEGDASGELVGAALGELVGELEGAATGESVGELEGAATGESGATSVRVSTLVLEKFCKMDGKVRWRAAQNQNISKAYHHFLIAAPTSQPHASRNSGTSRSPQNASGTSFKFSATNK